MSVSFTGYGKEKGDRVVMVDIIVASKASWCRSVPMIYTWSRSVVLWWYECISLLVRLAVVTLHSVWSRIAKSFRIFLRRRCLLLSQRTVGSCCLFGHLFFWYYSELIIPADGLLARADYVLPMSRYRKSLSQCSQFLGIR